MSLELDQFDDLDPLRESFPVENSLFQSQSMSAYSSSQASWNDVIRHHLDDKPVIPQSGGLYNMHSVASLSSNTSLHDGDVKQTSILESRRAMAGYQSLSAESSPTPRHNMGRDLGPYFKQGWSLGKVTI